MTEGTSVFLGDIPSQSSAPLPWENPEETWARWGVQQKAMKMLTGLEALCAERLGELGCSSWRRLRGYCQCVGTPGGRVQNRCSLRWDELGVSSTSSAQSVRPGHRTVSRKSPREGEEHWEISTEPGALAHSAGAQLLTWKEIFYS